jgi:hypothetical protein
MALRDQPYLPLYVQDFLTDEKLNECSAESTGVYIRLMCLMHKSKEYGTYLLLQNGWQNSGKTVGKTSSMCQEFAIRLSRHMPYDVDTISRSLEELLNYDVIQIDGNKILQRRMVRDNQISQIRSKAGKEGGFAKHFAKGFAIPKVLPNTEYENEYESVNDNESESKNKPVKNIKSKYGSQHNVLLTKHEIDKLREDYPNEADDAIEFLSMYIAEKGYKTKSHNLSIRRWVINAVIEKKAKTQTGQNKKASAIGNFDQRQYSKDELNSLYVDVTTNEVQDDQAEI